MCKSIQYLECGLLGAVHALAPRNWTTGTIECQANSLGCCCLYVQSMEARARQPEERLKCQGFDWITRPSFHPPSLRGRAHVRSSVRDIQSTIWARFSNIFAVHRNVQLFVNSIQFGRCSNVQQRKGAQHARPTDGHWPKVAAVATAAMRSHYNNRSIYIYTRIV